MESLSPIVFTGGVTYADHKRIVKALFTKRTSLSSRIIEIITFIVIGILILSMEIELYEKVLIIIAVIGVLTAAHYTMESQNKKRYDRQVSDIRKGHISKSNILIEFNTSKTILGWNHFDNYCEMDGLIAIVKGKEFIAFAQYMFRSKNEWIKSKELIQENLTIRCS